MLCSHISSTASCHSAFDPSVVRVSFGVASREEIAAWAARLDELGIEHTGVRDEQAPFTFATLVFRDPDNIQLEFIWTAPS